MSCVDGVDGEGTADADWLARFRGEFYRCLTRRADALFELTDALLCADGPVTSLVDLTLVAEHRRGHGALYDGLNSGRIEVGRLRRALGGLTLPRSADGRIMLAVDVSAWLRADAATSPDRLFCHVYGRGKGQAQMIPGWPYSFVAALEPGRTSWTAVLDAVRLGPADDATAVTAGQLRGVVERLVAAGQWRPGDPDILIVADTGYDVTRLAFVLADLPVQLLGRLRSDRVLRLPAPPRMPGAAGRPPRHGGEFALADPASWPEPQTTTLTQTSRYGTATAVSWDRLHPRLTHRTCWLDHAGDLPVIEGTLIRLQVEHLPGDRDPKPVWLWSSHTGATPSDVDRLWQAFLRRFDLEHTFRLFKQPSAGPPRRSETPRPPTAGPGSSWPPTPSYAWPAHWPRTSAAPGRNPPHPAGSPRPGSAAGFGTSVRRPPARPAHRNPANPDPDGHPAPATADPRPATT